MRVPLPYSCEPIYIESIPCEPVEAARAVVALADRVAKNALARGLDGQSLSDQPPKVPTWRESALGEPPILVAIVGQKSPLVDESVEVAVRRTGDSLEVIAMAVSRPTGMRFTLGSQEEQSFTQEFNDAKTSGEAWAVSLLFGFFGFGAAFNIGGGNNVPWWGRILGFFIGVGCLWPALSLTARFLGAIFMGPAVELLRHLLKPRWEAQGVLARERVRQGALIGIIEWKGALAAHSGSVPASPFHTDREGSATGFPEGSSPDDVISL